MYFKFVNVNLGKNLGIDLRKFCGTGPRLLARSARDSLLRTVYHAHFQTHCIRQTENSGIMDPKHFGFVVVDNCMILVKHIVQFPKDVVEACNARRTGPRGQTDANAFISNCIIT